MHELSLTQSIIELAIDHARRENAKTILCLTVEIGALSGVMAEAVSFAFDVCSQDTIAQGARLEIRHIPGLGRCLVCHEQTTMETLSYVCPLCGSLALETLQGQEMKFIEMEVD